MTDDDEYLLLEVNPLPVHKGKEYHNLVLRDKDLDEDYYITVDEFKQLVNLFPYGNRNRLCFKILGETGLRAGDLLRKDDQTTGLHITHFLNASMTRFKIKICKPTKRMYFTRGGEATLTEMHKWKEFQITEETADELRWYIEHHWSKIEASDDYRVFQFDQNTLRRRLNQIRAKARREQKLPTQYRDIPEELARGLLQVVALSTSYDVREPGKAPTIDKDYRIRLGSFRKFDTTRFHYLDAGQDMNKTSKRRGHTVLDTTAKHYMVLPHQIGLTVEDLIRKPKLSELLGGCRQMRINDYKH